MSNIRKREEEETKSEHPLSTLEALAMRVSGGALGLTENQVDEVLNQRGRTIEYMHADRKREDYNRRLFFIGTLAFLIIAGGGVLLLQPGYLGELVSAALGFGAGFGIARKAD